MSDSEKQKLTKAMQREAVKLNNLLSDEAKKQLNKWMEATDYYVHETLHGNYCNAFNFLRETIEHPLKVHNR